MNFILPRFALILLWLPPAALLAAPIADEPFWQDVAVRIYHTPELTNATFKKLYVDKENVAYVLTDKGVARIFIRSRWTRASARSPARLPGTSP